ncbi:MAG TPA: hypothetical protein VGP55_16155 [Chitinophagaceae bacterium]|nr:hypothetical protein [Chitinophagaceae bacterium]
MAFIISTHLEHRPRANSSIARNGCTGVFPYLLYATNNAKNSITIENGGSFAKTLKTLLIIALIGTPLIGIYTTFVFWTFKGKVKLNEMSL